VNPTIKIVFDASALVAYARLEGQAVGEMLRMVHEDEGRTVVGVPASAYVAAYLSLHDGDERGRLTSMMFQIENACVILPLTANDTMAVAALDGILGGIHIAQAILETGRHEEATLATYHASTARRRLDADAVFDLAEQM
jgi:hypothetical protein